MILEHLLSDITLEYLTKEVKGLEVDIPEQDDYDPDLWPEIKSKRFISTYEKIKGREGLWQLSFNKDRLYLIQFNIDFGSISENSYNNCREICRNIIKINNSVRGMRDLLIDINTKSYAEFKSEVVSVPDLPDGYYVQFVFCSWQGKEKSAYIYARYTMPDSMSVEYREEAV